MKKIILIIVFIILILLYFNSLVQPTVKIVKDSKEIIVYVELPKTPEEFVQGLMFRESLPENSGMLFIFQNEEKRSFWMKNMEIPLDIILYMIFTGKE